MVIRIFSVVAIILIFSSCSGLHHTNGCFIATGASINVIGMQIPNDPMVLAMGRVPENASITNVSGMPNDDEFLFGLLNRLLGIGYVKIGGIVNNEVK